MGTSAYVSWFFTRSQIRRECPCAFFWTYYSDANHLPEAAAVIAVIAAMGMLVEGLMAWNTRRNS